MSESEFGKGLCYNLGLFLAHAEKDNILRERALKKGLKGMEGIGDTIYGMWFNGSSDHLYELEIPKNIPKEIQDRLKEFQDKCLDFGHGLKMDNAKKEDVIWAIQEAKDLLRLIDKAHGIEVIKGDWE